MTLYEKYVFVLCLIVFLCFTLLFTVMIVSLLRSTVKLIRSGCEDDNIRAEYFRAKKKKKRFVWLPKVAAFVVSVVFVLAFCLSMVLFFAERTNDLGLATLRVVKTPSMATKHENNAYLDRNNLVDQLQVFDLILVHDLPDESELELYDIVVYKTENGPVIHRIIGIEEPNEKHPDVRYFRLQGDANKYSDSYPVLYSQMQAIYRGERVPFVGNIVLFLQAPAGWLCILLILFGQIAIPIVEKTLTREIEQRLRIMDSADWKELPASYSIAPIVISRFRMSMRIQRKDPIVHIRIHEEKGNLKITLPKGRQKK